jgi:hypothetical protein
MLKHLDDLQVFPRKDDGPTPFSLLDGHHSRMELPFMDYIHDPLHKWVVCIGVPYATHLWQVADSSEQNGSFKMECNRAKRSIYDKRPLGKKSFTNSDVIPIINKTWPLSFGKVDTN